MAPRDHEARVLQWGRNLTVAEGSHRWNVTPSYDLLQWGRNLTVAEGWVWADGATPTPSFNGAAT